jgi:hypothetical protein
LSGANRCSGGWANRFVPPKSPGPSMSIENRPGTRSPPIPKPSTCAGSSFGPARSWRPASLPCFFGVPPDAIDERTQVVKIAQDADMTYALAKVPRAECAVVSPARRVGCHYRTSWTSLQRPVCGVPGPRVSGLGLLTSLTNSIDSFGVRRGFPNFQRKDKVLLSINQAPLNVFPSGLCHPFAIETSLGCKLSAGACFYGRTFVISLV